MKYLYAFGAICSIMLGFFVAQNRKGSKAERVAGWTMIVYFLATAAVYLLLVLDKI